MDEKIIWSIGFVVIVIILCIVKPNIGRIFLGVFYLIMAIGINFVNAITNPQTTIQMGEASLFCVYREFFSVVVSKAIPNELHERINQMINEKNIFKGSIGLNDVKILIESASELPFEIEY